MWWHFKLQLMNNFVLIFSLELGKNRCLKRKFSKLQGRKINRVWNTSNSNKPRRKQSIEIGNIYVNRFSLLCKKIIGCLLLETFHLSSPIEPIFYWKLLGALLCMNTTNCMTCSPAALQCTERMYEYFLSSDKIFPFLVSLCIIDSVKLLSNFRVFQCRRQCL